MVLSLLGVIPEPGADVVVDGWRLTVTRMDRHRIAELAIRPLDEAVPQ
jgi:CBS domain containing-hemolysin-like protein